VALDALDLPVVVDNESDTLSSVDEGVPQLPELGRLVARVPHRAPIDDHDCVEPWGHLCLACHGFSALVTGRRSSEERSVLFDVGPSFDVWLENARRLGVRLASIETVDSRSSISFLFDLNSQSHTPLVLHVCVFVASQDTSSMARRVGQIIAAMRPQMAHSPISRPRSRNQ
jgi:hypothetical protein